LSFTGYASYASFITQRFSSGIRKKLEVDGKEYLHQACTYARAWHAHRDRQVVNIMPPMAERMSSGSIKN